MVKLRFSRSAIKDLTEIWNYTLENWSENQADKYYKLLYSACLLISKNPEKGNSYDNILSGLRGKRVSKHIVFYRIGKNGQVEILRILHEQMDIKSQLK